jgi:glutathione-regulated potassium-efflux system ancillary protein KefC
MEHSPAWLSSSLVYLSAAVLAVPLARALGLGSIIGYLVAGVAIGPFGFGLVKNVQDILHFAEFGVVLMLFLVGLELEPKRLWALRRPIFGWGSAQVFGCAAVLFAAGWAAGFPWSVALVAALGLALSSTAIALQVMNERHSLKTPAGQAGFSILLFQDVAAIPMLALIPLLPKMVATGAAQADATNAWIEGAKALGMIALIVVAGRLALNPLFSWIARSRTPEIFTAAALLLVVAIAWGMQFVGLSMALGAFLAGVLLAESEFKRELETDIEPFKGLLLGLFFIAVGMSIDFKVIAADPALVAAVVLGFLAIKGFVIYTLSRSMQLDIRERPVFTLLLAQGGEFAFVVFQAAGGAGGAGVLDERLTSILIGAVALSMLLSPLILVLIDKVLMPRLYKPDLAAGKPAEISEQQEHPVVIAGFGRYGQIISRMLMANRISATVLDHDPARIETAKAFGYRVFYGDATRLDLLRIAGAAQAKVIMVAVDDVASSNAIVDLAREHFAQAKLIVRVRDLTHAYDLMDRGIDTFDRELFEASMSSGRRVLHALGFAAHDVAHMAGSFHKHNTEQMLNTHKVRHDRAQLIALAKKSRIDLEEQMQQDRNYIDQARIHADAIADSFNLPKNPGA